MSNISEKDCGRSNLFFKRKPKPHQKLKKGQLIEIKIYCDFPYEDHVYYKYYEDKNGLKQGNKIDFFYPDLYLKNTKTIKTESNYLNNDFHGIQKDYIKNGKLKYIENWKRGDRFGEVVYYKRAITDNE